MIGRVLRRPLLLGCAVGFVVLSNSVLLLSRAFLYPFMFDLQSLTVSQTHSSVMVLKTITWLFLFQTQILSVYSIISDSTFSCDPWGPFEPQQGYEGPNAIDKLYHEDCIKDGPLDCDQGQGPCHVYCEEDVPNSIPFPGPNVTNSLGVKNDACANVTINCPDSSDSCFIDCIYSCYGMIVNAQTSQYLEIYNCGIEENGCDEMTIYCPQQNGVNSVSVCNISAVTAQSNTISGLNIYSQQSFFDASLNSLQLIGNNNIMHCGATATEYNCIIDNVTASNCYNLVGGCQDYVFTETPTRTPTTPTIGPTAPTQPPTNPPTRIPTTRIPTIPTKTPTNIPTKVPTKNPTHIPTLYPTFAPTTNPTLLPTISPTSMPTMEPVFVTSNAVTDKVNNITFILAVLGFIVLGMFAVAICFSSFVFWRKYQRYKSDEIVHISVASNRLETNENCVEIVAVSDDIQSEIVMISNDNTCDGYAGMADKEKPVQLMEIDVIEEKNREERNSDEMQEEGDNIEDMFVDIDDEGERNEFNVNNNRSNTRTGGGSTTTGGAMM